MIVYIKRTEKNELVARFAIEQRMDDGLSMDSKDQGLDLGNTKVKLDFCKIVHTGSNANESDVALYKEILDDEHHDSYISERILMHPLSQVWSKK